MPKIKFLSIRAISVMTKAKSMNKSKQNNNLQNTCVVCKKGCIDEKKVPRVICRVRGPVTRSVTKILDDLTNFIIIEEYRCMPLLGNEQEIAPDWEVHIVHYAIVFTSRKK